MSLSENYVENSIILPISLEYHRFILFYGKNHELNETIFSTTFFALQKYIEVLIFWIK